MDIFRVEVFKDKKKKTEIILRNKIILTIPRRARIFPYTRA